METNNLDTGPRRTTAKKLACNILKRAKITQPPISLQEIIELLEQERDLVVTKANLSDRISGVVVTCKNLDGEFATIIFNENHPWCRRRLTIAHEIGHLMFGHSCGAMDAHNEREAYIFAAELLMPFFLLKEDVKKRLPIPDLAQRYRVSQEALTIKLMEERLLKSVARG